MNGLNKFDKLYQKIITEMAENQTFDCKDAFVSSADEICKDWGWLNEMEWNPELGKKFNEASRLHKEMVKNDPEHHKLVEYDDGRCVHTYECKCGFSYKVDSSRIIFYKIFKCICFTNKKAEFLPPFFFVINYINGESSYIYLTGKSLVLLVLFHDSTGVLNPTTLI